jgi:biotin carboxylase
MTHHLMLVGVGYMGSGYVTAAERLGVDVTMVETAAHVQRLGDHVTNTFVTDGLSEDSWKEAALAAALQHGRPSGVVAFSEYQVMAAAAVQDLYGLSGPSDTAAAFSRDKRLQRETFAAHHLAQPEFRIVDGSGGLRSWVRERLPVIVKPTGKSGSEGVRVIESLDEFDDARESAHDDTYLVETLASGDEFSWEALVRNGEVLFENYTAKETTGPPSFVEVGHRAGQTFDESTLQRLTRLTRGVLAAISMGTGIVHLEFRTGTGGDSIMEVAVRTPGDRLMEVVGGTWGIDMFESVIRLALGMPLPAIPDSPIEFHGSWLPNSGPGVIESIEGIDRLHANPYVRNVQILANVGDEVRPLSSSGERLGCVLFAAPSHDELDDGIADARGAFSVKLTIG